MDNAIILAGGFGTRLRSVVSDRPKALAEVSGKPFIEYQLEWLLKQGVKQVTIATHYMADQLQEFVNQWQEKGLVLDTVYEDEPLGTGGAVANVINKKEIIGKVLVINGDTLFNFSLKPVIKYMKNRKESVVLVASRLSDVHRFGTIIVENGYVKSFQQATGKHEAGIVNGGAYIVESDLFREKIEPFSLEYDLFPLLTSNMQLLAYLVDKSEGFIDIGTPESYRNICSKFKTANE
jgi:D-glycero-alpha-D-manno-heptose 1-phosphate guanylyltransferase